MKKVLIFVFVIIGLIVIYNLLPLSDNKNLGDKIILYEGDAISINNTNLKIKLVDIMDGRCSGDVNCIWQGELTYNLKVSDGKESYNYKLGSEKNVQISIVDKYVVSLIDYEEKYAVIVVEKYNL